MQKGILPQRIIPVSGETIRVLGLGTWKSFDVAPDAAGNRLREVLQGFFGGGARLLDTSPTYGKAEHLAENLAAAACAASQSRGVRDWRKYFS